MNGTFANEKLVKLFDFYFICLLFSHVPFVDISVLIHSFPLVNFFSISDSPSIFSHNFLFNVSSSAYSSYSPVYQVSMGLMEPIKPIINVPISGLYRI